MFLSCITRKYFSDTLKNIRILFSEFGYSSVLIEEKQCCGWPFQCQGNTLGVEKSKQDMDNLLSQSGLDLYFLEKRCFDEYSQVGLQISSKSSNSTYAKPKQFDIQVNKFYEFQHLEVLFISSCFDDGFLKRTFLNTQGLVYHKIPFGFCCGANSTEQELHNEFNSYIALQLEGFVANNPHLICVFDDDFCRLRMMNAIKENDRFKNLELLHWADLIIKYGSKKRISTL